MDPDWHHDRIRHALAGTNPSVMAQLGSGFAVFGDVQFLPGYTVFLSNNPDICTLHELPRDQRLAYLSDVDAVAQAVADACAGRDPGFLRVNIEILGNADPFLHTHIFPRYSWETLDEQLMHRRPVWHYPPERWRDASYAADFASDPLMREISNRLASGPNAADSQTVGTVHH